METGKGADPSWSAGVEFALLTLEERRLRRVSTTCSPKVPPVREVMQCFVCFSVAQTHCSKHQVGASPQSHMSIEI